MTRPSFDVIVSGLLVGPEPTALDIARLSVTRIVCLARTPAVLPDGVEVIHRPLTYWDDDAPVATLSQVVAEVVELIDGSARTLVHCRLGLDRCGIVAIAVLMRHLKCSLSHAVLRYSELRQTRLPRPDALIVLWAYAAVMEAAELG